MSGSIRIRRDIIFCRHVRDQTGHMLLAKSVFVLQLHRRLALGSTHQIASWFGTYMFVPVHVEYAQPVLPRLLIFLSLCPVASMFSTVQSPPPVPRSIVYDTPMSSRSDQSGRCYHLAADWPVPGDAWRWMSHVTILCRGDTFPLRMVGEWCGYWEDSISGGLK